MYSVVLQQCSLKQKGPEISMFAQPLHDSPYCDRLSPSDRKPFLLCSHEQNTRECTIIRGSIKDQAERAPRLNRIIAQRTRAGERRNPPRFSVCRVGSLLHLLLSLLFLWKWPFYSVHLLSAPLLQFMLFPIIHFQ